jgi:hypothetical protein
MKNNFKILLFISTILLLSACVTERAELEANIFVKDFYQKPLDNQSVILTASTLSVSAQTDVSGKSRFDTYWNGTFSNQNFTFKCPGTSDLFATNFITSPRNNGAIESFSITDTIIMDTVKNMRLVIKSKRLDLEYYNLKVFTKGNLENDFNHFNIVERKEKSETNAPIGRNFFMGKITKKDTTFTIKPYANAGFTIQIFASYPKTQFLEGTEIIIKDFEKRDDVLLIEF